MLGTLWFYRLSYGCNLEVNQISFKAIELCFQLCCCLFWSYVLCINFVVFRFEFNYFQTKMTRIRQIKQKCRVFFVILLVTVAFLHLIALPALSGGYNDECFLPDEKRQILRTMVQNISRAFDKFDVHYWLDYGECHSQGWSGGRSRKFCDFGEILIPIILHKRLIVSPEITL